MDGAWPPVFGSSSTAMRRALARALRMAVELDPKTGGHAPSTKGVL